MSTKTAPKGSSAPRSPYTKRLTEASKSFETAKNDYFRVLALDKLLDLLDEEILHWVEIYDGLSMDESGEAKELSQTGQKTVSDLEELQTKLITERESLLDNALALQRAMINSHVLKFPVIIDSREPKS